MLKLHVVYDVWMNVWMYVCQLCILYTTCMLYAVCMYVPVRVCSMYIHVCTVTYIHMTYVCITNPQATICKPLCWIISLSKVYYALCWNSVQNPTANNNPRPANKQFGWPKSVDQCNRPKEQWTDNKATNSNSKTNSKNSKMLTSSTWLQDLKNWIRGRSVEHKK